MDNILFIDTETTGLPLNYELDYSHTSNWPRLVQLAWLLFDGKGALLESCSFIIKPEGFQIPQKSIEIHRIDNNKATNEGEELINVLYKFSEVLAKSKFLIGHNIKFDERVVGCELFRKHFDTARLNLISKFCTMRNEKIISFCNFNGKRPTLNELYYKLFKKNIINSHDALSDVVATSNCYFELVKKGIIDINESKITNVSHVTVSQSVQTNKSQISRLFKDDIENKISLIPLVNELKKVCTFENYQVIKSNEYQDFDIDDDGFDDDMLQRIHDEDYNDYLLQNVQKENEILMGQIDENSIGWNKKYNEVSIFSSCVSIGKKVDKYYFLDANTGKMLLEHPFELISVINDNTVIVRKEGKFGMMDNLLNQILPFEFSRIVNYENTFFLTMKFETSTRYSSIFSKNTRYGLFHINRFDLLPIEYEELSYFNYGLFSAKKIGEQLFGLINIKGEQLLGSNYLDFHTLDQHYPNHIVAKSNGTITLFRYDISEKNIKKLMFVNAEKLYFEMIKDDEILFKFKRNGYWGIINYSGNVLIQAKYSSFDYSKERDLIKVSIKSNYEGQLYGLLDSSYREILPCEFSKIGEPLNGLSIVTIGKDSRMQVINLQGKIINKEKFYFASHNLNGMVAFINGNIEIRKVGYIFKDDMRINNLTIGLLNEDGKVIIEQIWHKFYLKILLEKIMCDEVFIYILNYLKGSINNYVSYDYNCYDYKKFTKEELWSDFRVNYTEIDQHIIDIKNGKANEVLKKIFI